MFKNPNAGYWLITFLCCIWPLIWAAVAVFVSRRIGRGGQ
jgi:hypothetical protein